MTGGNIRLRNYEDMDYQRVYAIFEQAIEERNVTFRDRAPTLEEWDRGYRRDCRIVAINSEKEVVGFVALSSISARACYQGVVDVSIYIDMEYRGQGIGKLLLNSIIKRSEELGIWMLESAIFEINLASIALHSSCGFRMVGTREHIAKDLNGQWQNTVFMERRSDYR